MGTFKGRMVALKEVFAIQSWKTRLGFYLIIGNEIFKFFEYSVSDSITIIGFAFLLLGIAHKLEGK